MNKIEHVFFDAPRRAHQQKNDGQSIAIESQKIIFFMHFGQKKITLRKYPIFELRKYQRIGSQICRNCSIFNSMEDIYRNFSVCQYLRMHKL